MILFFLRIIFPTPAMKLSDWSASGKQPIRSCLFFFLVVCFCGGAIKSYFTTVGRNSEEDGRLFLKCTRALDGIQGETQEEVAIGRRRRTSRERMRRLNGT